MSEARATTPCNSRDRLIAAMAQSCAERGFEETDIAEVARMAGCSEFDLHFESKEDCALAAVDAILAEAISAIGGSYSPDTSEGESAMGALRALLELFAACPAPARLAFIDSRQAMPESAMRRYESGFAILTAMLDRLRSESANHQAVPPLAARAAIGGGEALVRRKISEGQAGELPGILPDLVYGAAVPFLGQRAALKMAQRAREALAS